MDQQLLKRLESAAARYRKRSFFRWAAFAAFMAVVIALASRPWGREVMLRSTLGWLVGGWLVSAMIAWRRFRNIHWIAEQIEKQHPELQAKLITAVEQVDQKKDDYFHHRLVRETTTQARTQRWEQIVSDTSLMRNRVAGIMATLGLVGVLTFLVTQPASHNVASQVQKRLTLDGVIIQPGDTEIPKGTNLLVTADWSSVVQSRLPATNPQLLWIDETGNERQIDLKRNLADPVWGGMLTGLDLSGEYRVEAGDANWSYQSPTYKISVFEYPKMVRSDAHLEFPRYTKLENKQIIDTVRVTAVEGTEVTWRCLLNKPVDTAQLKSKTGTTLTLEQTTDDPRWMQASFTLTEDMNFEIELVDNQGRLNQFPAKLSCKVIRNRAPSLKPTLGGDASVSPLQEFEVAVDVQDDFGIQEAGISYTLEDQSTQEIVLLSNSAARQKKTLTHQINFEDLHAQPDQLLSYTFWVDDLDTDGQTRRTHSDLFFAEVRPFEEIFREGQPPPGSPPGSPPASAAAQQAEKLMELQKKIMQATWKRIENRDDSRFAEEVDILVQSQKEALGLLEELASQVSDPQSSEHVDETRKQMSLAVELLQQSADAEVGGTSHLQQALQAERAAYAGLLRLRARETEVIKTRQQQGQGRAGQQSQRRRSMQELELKQDENRYETQSQAQQQQQQQEQQEDRDLRQVLNRLRELAERQSDLNEEIAQLQSAIQMAESEDEQEALQRRLKRLREQQDELLRDADESAQRANAASQNETMRQTSEQLAETREQMRQSSQALQENDPAGALASGKRSQRELEEMRDELAQEAAGQFDQSMKAMRDQARGLAEQQEQISEQLESLDEAKPSQGLRGNDERQEVAEALSEQQDQLAELLEKMQTTVEQAESSQPLLAQNLYDSFRRTQQSQTGRQLESASQLVQQGFDAQAREFEQPARESIEQLKEEMEAAAESVLGDETEGLRRALEQLERLQSGVASEAPNSEADRGEEANSPSGQSSPAQSTPEDQSPSESPNGQQQASNQNPQSEQSQSEQGQAQQGQAEQGQSQQGQSQQGQSQQGQSQQGQAQQQSSRRRPAGLRASGPTDSNTEPRTDSAGIQTSAAQSPMAGPITGEGFREWSDAMRDVEEMVDDRQLRSRATQIRERVRQMRVEFRRHSKAPQWELLEELVAGPLEQLRTDVSAELMRRTADKQKLVPIDRDPVPQEYAKRIEQYYERLAGDSEQVDSDRD